MLDQTSRLLPGYALYPATFVLLIALLLAMRSTSLLSGRFLIAIVWLRYVMQAYHDITHAPLLGGASLNALVSVAVCIVGFFILARRIDVLGRLPFVLLLLAVIVISGLMNGAYAGMFETVLKWGYFLVVVLCVYDCVQRSRNAELFGPLLWAFAPPLVFQALSIYLGVSKASEADGSVSYIGGFHHEAAYSVVLVTCFVVTTLAPRLNPLLRAAILALCIAGIFAANYRTSLIALAPMAIGFLAFSVARAFTQQQRALVSLVSFVLVIAAVGAAGWMMRERLSDLYVALDAGERLAKLPGEFTRAEMALFSGRLYLWSQYVEAYLAGGDFQILLGFGPDAWAERFSHYAHNTLISYLYEFGAIGAGLIVCVWLAMFVRAGAVRDPWLRWQLWFAHFGFVVLNFATMPHWQIEGMILYGLLCGYTEAMAALSQRRVMVFAYPRPTHEARPAPGPSKPAQPAETGSR
jgi:hypothetical protein